VCWFLTSFVVDICKVLKRFNLFSVMFWENIYLHVCLWMEKVLSIDFHLKVYSFMYKWKKFCIFDRSIYLLVHTGGLQWHSCWARTCNRNYYLYHFSRPIGSGWEGRGMDKPLADNKSIIFVIQREHEWAWNGALLAQLLTMYVSAILEVPLPFEGHHTVFLLNLKRNAPPSPPMGLFPSR